MLKIRRSASTCQKHKEAREVQNSRGDAEDRPKLPRIKGREKVQKKKSSSGTRGNEGPAPHRRYGRKERRAGHQVNTCSKGKDKPSASTNHKTVRITSSQTAQAAGGSGNPKRRASKRIRGTLKAERKTAGNPPAPCERVYKGDRPALGAGGKRKR